MMSRRADQFLSFIGRRPALFGTGTVITGFVTFGFDLVLALCLQRFFMAAKLVPGADHLPFDLALMSPTAEAVLLILVGFLRSVSVWGNGYLTGRCQVAVETEKRADIARWALSSGQEAVGRVLNLFNDITIGTATSISNLFYVLSRSVLFTGLIFVMASYSVALTGFVFLIVFLITPLQRLIDKMLTCASVVIQRSMAQSVESLSSAVKNSLFLKLHDLEAQETGRIVSDIEGYGWGSNRYYALSSLRSVIPQTLGLAAVVLIALQGSAFFAGNAGTLVSYLYLVLRLFQILSDFARVSGNLRLNLPRVKIMWAWWHESRACPMATITSVSSISGPVGWRGRGVFFDWPDGSKTAIQDLSFSIPSGSLTLITGESGTGKTTLLHLLIGLLTPTRGALEWIGAGAARHSLDGRLPARVSYVGSDPFMVPGTVRDQLQVGQNSILPDEKLIESLRRVRAEFVFDLPRGLDHPVSEQGIGLSAGQKQRLALARALLREPSVLLLDEATANLDPVTEQDVLAILHMLKGKMTILVISHRPHPVLRPDQIISLGGGR